MISLLSCLVCSGVGSSWCWSWKRALLLRSSQKGYDFGVELVEPRDLALELLHPLLVRDLPLLSLSPVFMMLTSYVMVGQTISLAGAGAILVMMGGSFVLQHKRGLGPAEMLRAFAREKGTRLMLLVAFLWSITSNFDKLCIMEVGPHWYPFFFAVTFSLLYLPFLLRQKVPLAEGFRTSWLSLLLMGLFTVLAIMPQMLAVDVAPHVAYVITIKRSGWLLFGILFGALFFHERNLAWRIAGAFLIMIGLGILLADAVGLAMGGL